MNNHHNPRLGRILVGQENITVSNQRLNIHYIFNVSKAKISGIFKLCVNNVPKCLHSDAGHVIGTQFAFVICAICSVHRLATVVFRRRFFSPFF